MPSTSSMLLNQLAQGPQMGNPLDRLESFQNLQKTSRLNQLGGKLNLQDPNLQALAQVDPITALKMSGKYDRTQKGGLQKRFEVKQDNAEKAQAVGQEILRLEQSKRNISDPLELQGIQDRIDSLKNDYARYTSQKQFVDQNLVRSKEDRAKGSYELKQGDEAESDLERVDKFKDEAVATLKDPEMRSYMNSYNSFKTVMDTAEEAKTNVTTQPELIVNLKKISDSSQVLLSEMETALNQSIESKVKRSFNKAYSGKFLEPADIENIKRTANKLVQAKVRAYNKGYKSAEKRAKNKLSKYNKKEGSDFSLSGYGDYQPLELPPLFEAKPKKDNGKPAKPKAIPVKKDVVADPISSSSSNQLLELLKANKAKKAAQ